ncbi:hypothetical protein NPIL_361921, partial [Nephila pilipes]
MRQFRQRFARQYRDKCCHAGQKRTRLPSIRKTCSRRAEMLWPNGFCILPAEPFCIQQCWEAALPKWYTEMAFALLVPRYCAYFGKTTACQRCGSSTWKCSRHTATMAVLTFLQP